jgi:hypothetical protein
MNVLLRRSGMKVYHMLFITSVLFLSSSAAVSTEPGTSDREKEISEQIVNMKNPFTEQASLSEAEAKAGFSMKQLKYIPSYYDPVPKIYVLDDGVMIQVVYVEPMDQKRITYRASKKISTSEMNGDYSEYPDESRLKIGDLNLLVKGSDGVIYTAEWAAGGINYCLLIDDGMEEIEIKELFIGAQEDVPDGGS